MAVSILHELTLETITPTQLQTRSASRQSRTVAIPLSNAEDTLVILRPAALRTGEHVLFFALEADALDALDILSSVGSFGLTYPEVPAWEMRFAVVGDLTLSQDPVTVRRWTVTVPYQELAP